jgi:hypothetical protein
MFLSPKKKDSIETRVNIYLQQSYHTGYNLDYFTDEQKIKMFEKLLKCDSNFNQQWQSGFYVTPEDPTNTMYLSSYIKKQSILKKTNRRLFRYVYSGKLTKGAENLLKGYMIEYSQNQTKTIDEKMNEIFCGIFSAVNKRKQDIINTAIRKSTNNQEISGIHDNIKSYYGSGINKTKTKFKIKKYKIKNKVTRKNIVL